MNILICVDVQNDFLPGGTLAVPNGDEVVPALVFAAANSDYVVASRDWHPLNHSSFIENGGEWPFHCVRRTPGAMIHPEIFKVADDVLSKGQDPWREEYSACNVFVCSDWPLPDDPDEHIEIFVGGLATEYCVFNTARDLLTNGYSVTVLKDATRGLDSIACEMALTEINLRGGKIV